MTGASDPRIPDYSGGSLSNLMAELEFRLTGSAVSPRLHRRLAKHVPDADTYVLVLIDGLGVHQLDHPAAGPLADAYRATIHAPFPTTTTVSLATVATGLAPRRHGWIGHFVLLPGHPTPVNSLRWIDAAGKNVAYHTAGLLPALNLWERLQKAGVAPITVQPAPFGNSPLSQALYRGCRFEGVTTTGVMARATVELARVRGRLVFAYYPYVDIAAHMKGPASPDYARAMADIARAWDLMAAYLPAHAAMVGTADHGVVQVDPAGKLRLHRRDTPGLTLFGDPRSLFVNGPAERIAELGARLPATWYPRARLEPLWGPGDDPEGATTLGLPAPLVKPDGAFLTHDGMAILPGHMDRRLVGYHGGLDPREVEIPLLVA